MDNDELLALAERLEGEATGARSRLYDAQTLHLYGLEANRAGYLRLAAMFLRTAAVEVYDDGETHLQPLAMAADLDQRVLEEFDGRLGSLSRREEWPEPTGYEKQLKASGWRRDRRALLTCGVVGFFGLMLVSLLGALFNRLIEYFFGRM